MGIYKREFDLLSERAASQGLDLNKVKASFEGAGD